MIWIEKNFKLNIFILLISVGVFSFFSITNKATIATDDNNGVHLVLDSRNNNKVPKNFVNPLIYQM